MHKHYNNDGKLRLIQGMTREEALEMENALNEDDLALTSTTASADALIRIISHSSQNALCFYPERLHLEEAIKRGLDVEELVSSLPLLNRDCLFVPKGAPLWGRGKNYRVF